jgi:hypothetical protein
MGYKRQQIAKVCDVCKRDFKGNNKQKNRSRECACKRQKEQLAALAEYRRKRPHCGEPLGPMSGRRRVRNDTVALTPHSPSLTGRQPSGPAPL